MAVHETYYPSGQLERTGMGAQGTQMSWLVIILVALPLILTLILVGLFYEVLLQLDRARRLDNRVRWAVSGACGVLLAAALTIAVRDWLFSASLTG